MSKIVKFNNGNGALLCNGCLVIIAYGFDHEDKEHYCSECKHLDKTVSSAPQEQL